MRGGWIEIIITGKLKSGSETSHPMRGGWIEIAVATPVATFIASSHPMRGGWIEISANPVSEDPPVVPPHAGWVD